MEESTLELIFQSSAGRRKTIRISDPKDTLTDAEVQTAMNDIVAKNIFAIDGIDLTTIVGARIVDRTVNEFEVA